jgi:hypothetical protein
MLKILLLIRRIEDGLLYRPIKKNTSDTGRSGWWQLIVLFPIIGFMIFIVLLVLASHEANDHGVNLKLVTPA